MDPTLAARALSAATEITSTALSGDDPGAVLDTVVARAAELADADLGLAMVSTDDGRVVVEAAHYATAHPTRDGNGRPGTGTPTTAAGLGARHAPEGAERTGEPRATLGDPTGSTAPAGDARLSDSDRPSASLDSDTRASSAAGDGARLSGGPDSGTNAGSAAGDGARPSSGPDSGTPDPGTRASSADGDGAQPSGGPDSGTNAGSVAAGDGTQPFAAPESTSLSGTPSAGESLRGLTLPADSAAGQVARGGEPVSSEDFTVDPRTAPFVPVELHGYGPFAAAPFGSGGRVLGSLTVYRKRGREPFSAGTVEMLVAFAAQAGVVLALAEGANARHRVALYEERERIARELHDVIVQRLYGAGMQLDRVRRNMRKRFAQADGARLSDAIDQLDQTIEEIRGTVRALRSPEPRHDTGTPTDLAESARGEVRIAGELLGYPPTLELSGEFADIPAERADHIRAALREALSNVVRHSGASETRVTLTRDSGGVKLRVRDNGSGVPQGVATRGLRHLAERADAAGGKFFLNSSPSLGTLVAFDLPLD
ncbi:histidine kinase [Amycolatopsis rifamycinica]|uniref:Histidine kinase n=1 Tax=Amycolatopsis rifamycinica TaxID=287986 RepID=A0A066TPK7_9PSEU|nr:histidine kinase [Amycolatopsis rifamycinica]